MTRNQPNILIFNPDQWRGDVLGIRGNRAASTPNLDKMVEKEGVAFTSTFCQNPVCTPSRCSFMSGWYPHVRGHRTLHHMMQPDEPVLLRTLKEEGYYVWWGGKNDLIPGDANFDDYCSERHKVSSIAERNNLHVNNAWRGDPGSKSYYSFYAGPLEEDKNGRYRDSDWENIDAAINRIYDPPKDQPLCIYLPLLYPHPPYGVETTWFNKIEQKKLPNRIKAPSDWDNKPSMLKGIFDRQNMQDWTEDEWDDLRATYYGMCARVDYQFGLIIKALKEMGMYDNTAIFFFSDHGDYTGDYGLVEKNQNTFEDCLTNVPLIIKPPKSFEVNPGVCNELVELIDVPATIEDLLNIEPNHTHFGKSLLPLIKDKKIPHRDAVFSEGGRLKDELHASEMESIKHTIPEGLYWPRVGLQITDGVKHTKAIMCRTKKYKYIKRLYEEDEFYDLVKDPDEKNNEINNEEYRKIITKMRERLLVHYIETSDVVPKSTDAR